MNSELSLLVTWLQSKTLSLNINKTNFMLFQPRKQKIRSTIKNQISDKPIEEVEYTKFLGVIMDSKLLWKQHIKYISNKVYKGVGFC
jgi:hypothetical protein